MKKINSGGLISSQKRILIIEDDHDVRVMEKNILEFAGYEVVGVNNAKDGLAILSNESIDLVILDIRLPSKKRGIGAARLIRSHPKSFYIPIIFVTAYEHGQETNEVKNISMCEYITKPFEVDELFAVVKKFLKN